RHTLGEKQDHQRTNDDPKSGHQRPGETTQLRPFLIRQLDSYRRLVGSHLAIIKAVSDLSIFLQPAKPLDPFLRGAVLSSRRATRRSKARTSSSMIRDA